MPKNDTPKSYEALSSELEEVLTDLQNPDVSLDAAMSLYERGLGLAKQLETRLKVAENKITKLKLQAGNASGSET